MSFFETLELLPEDPIFGLPKIFQADPRPQKVNLGVGTYLDATGKPYVLASVREAEQEIIKQEHSKEYLPIPGDPAYIDLSLQLMFGADNSRLKDGLIFGFQTVGGTGALRIGGEFLAQTTSKVVFLSDPTWPNHKPVFTRAGLRVEFYKYYDDQNHRVDFAGLCATIKIMPPASVIVLQACCQNPTGMDLTFAQWQEISDLIKKQKIFPFFDLPYQGFDKGVDEDAKVIRYFVDQGHEMMVAYSYSKNFGVYCERVGLLSLVVHSKETAAKITSQIKQMIRGNYSNPPAFGARIVEAILKNPELKASWKRELQAMRDRIVEMREALTFGLQSKSLHKDFSFLIEQKGMFSFSGLDSSQVQRLRDQCGIYMVGDGRMNVAGLNPTNIDYVIESILAILTP